MNINTDTYGICGTQEKDQAMARLLEELNAGIHSAGERGWITSEELRRHISERKKKLK